MTQHAVTIELPPWLVQASGTARATHFTTSGDRMRFVIELARRNVREGTGGPFAAAVFNQDTGCLIAAAVNRVVAEHCSAAHAEILALMLAQKQLGSHDLGAAGIPPCELVTSTEPCAMCMGAVPWSGVRRVVCGARGEDAEAIGMDEGSKPPDWEDQLRRRGIDVIRDVLRSESAAVLRQYADGGGVIYNGRRG
jgi:tRNA(Arg) A34 adenosine deaminase TadA